MAETLINSNQIRAVGDTSSGTLLNTNQVRAVGDISTKTLINPNQVATPVQLYAYSDGNNNTIYAKDEDLQGTFKSLNTNDFTNNGAIIDSNGIATFTGNDVDNIVSNTNFKVFGNLNNLRKGYYFQCQICVSSAFQPDGRFTHFIMENFSTAGFRHQWSGSNNQYMMGIGPGYSNIYANGFGQDYTELLFEILNNSNYRFKVKNVYTEETQITTTQLEMIRMAYPFAIKPNIPASFDLKRCYLLNSEGGYGEANYNVLVKRTYCIFNTTSQLYNSSFQKITATAENYNDVIVINGTTYTRDTTKDTTAVVPD